MHESFSILVAEDSPVNQKLILAFLKKLGYQADLANNGLEALERCLHKKYALILMDCQMPVLDGFQAATKIIQDHPSAADRPHIIALTASTLIEDRERCAQAGMNGYLVKPVKLKELEELIATVESQRRVPLPSSRG